MSLFSLSIESIAEVTDNDIRQTIIDQSIANYAGACPCPYNRTSNGSLCGKRSAWSRLGGEAPYCYATDVSDKMVNAFRKNNR